MTDLRVAVVQSGGCGQDIGANVDRLVAGTTASFFGSSCIIDPAGDLVDRAPAHRQPEFLRAAIDLDRVAAQRDYFPLGRDKRWELFEGLPT